ncbi:hypothetical protein ACLB2K_068361 [Fragaria x ananassa]
MRPPVGYHPYPLCAASRRSLPLPLRAASFRLLPLTASCGVPSIITLRRLLPLPASCGVLSVITYTHFVRRPFGKIVSFQPSSSGAGASEVYVHSLVTEQSLVDRSCLSMTADDRETWGLLRVMFKDDGTARTNLITHLGFIVPEETKEIVQDDLSAEVNAPGIEDSTTDKAGLGAEKETTIFPSDNGEDFFNNLPSPKADTPHSTSGDKFVAGGTVPITDHVQEEHDELEESADSSNALAVGDYKGAVAKCISANKMADALVIAHAGGPTLWESTRDQYLKLSHSPYRKIVSAMVSNYLSSLVNTRPLKFWKETLAVLCSFSSVEAWEDLCNTLAARHIAAEAGYKAHVRTSVHHRPAPMTARLHPSGLQQRLRSLSLPGESAEFQFFGEITQNFK